MTQHSILHIPFLSFFSKPFYRDVGKYWTGLNFLYLLILLAVCWLPIMVEIQPKISAALGEGAHKYAIQIPPIEVVEGKLFLKEPQPYLIVDPDTGEPFIIIDTTGEISSLDDTEARMLVTSTRLVARKGQHEIREYDLSQIEYFAIDQHRIQGWLKFLQNWLVILIYPFAVLGSFAYRILQALIYAAIGILITRFLKTTLDYTTLVRLATVVISPVIILDTLRNILNLSIPGWWFLCFLIAMCYLYFGIRATIETSPIKPDAAVQTPSI